METILFVLNTLLVAVGFGFVIFWHELGHFLAAKWAGVRVEQFAVGFGNAIVSWRKGLGARFGTSAPAYEQLKLSDPARAATVSPTEYRLNWLPLGGYVKMYGQEDMVASTTSPDADHYMNKSVGKRMVIISAGVVMNVILAAILFTVLFFMGFNAPAPVVGLLTPGGPAERAGVQVGDRILEINGDPTYAWTNVGIATALLHPDEPAEFLLQPPGTGGDPAARKLVRVTPELGAGAGGMVGVGIGGTPLLRGVDPRWVKEDEATLARYFTPDQFAVRPGEQVVAVAGQAVTEADWHVLHHAVEAAGGRPVPITVKTRDGREEARQVVSRLIAVGAEDEKAAHGLLGLLPLVEVAQMQANSPNLGKLLPGDVIERLTVAGTADTLVEPSLPQMRGPLAAAGKQGGKVDVVVRRNGERVTLGGLELTLVNPDNGQYGRGFLPSADTGSTRLGGVRDGSPAAKAGVPARGRVTAINGRPVSSWNELHAQLAAAARDGSATAVTVTVEQDGAAPSDFLLPLEEASRRAVLAATPEPMLPFVLAPNNEYKIERVTRNPLQAMWWGVRETQTQILQLYVTLKRVAVDQTVSPKNLTGPVGIFQFGTLVAQRGPDWLIWFLAMISANLAVVNFLPIPILDGGHMVFLASEKVTGRPPSPRVQTAALYAGLLLIVGLVLFVTYNDIQRLFT